MSESVDRMKGKRLVKAIVYGNTATPLGYKRESDSHTHQWTVFLKPYHIEDPSHYIRKVQFRLHDSFAVPIRVCDKPPYEVTETGWGEFEVQIRIYFVDINEKPVVAFHYLRLFQPIITLPNGSTQVVSEYYDELIFQEPTVTMYKALSSGKGEKCNETRFKNDLQAQRKETVARIKNANEQILHEINDLRESLREAHRLFMKYSSEIDESNPSTPRASISL